LHPRTRKQAEALGLSPNGVRVLEPVSYLDMLLLEKNARVILTDSGGVQKEAFFFRVPCVTLREETEWVETVEAGWNTLVGCDPHRIIQAVNRVQLPNNCQPSLYGDGRAAKRIVRNLAQTWTEDD
ncbi:MAG: UDP-N-acetylglucosamine 2-epimerase, partial [Candidatus Methanomethyliaceae archaeon]